MPLNVSRETNKPIKLNRLFTKFVYFGRLLRGNFATKLNKKKMENVELFFLDIENASNNTCYIYNLDDIVIDTYNFETNISFKGFTLEFYGIKY